MQSQPASISLIGRLGCRPPRAAARDNPRTAPPGARRRGVASVLAMMFLVIFGSLAAAMAVVAQGNLRTADSALKVSRAMSAAETGLVFASRRLAQESSRFIVEKGVIDADFAEDLWMGYLGSGEVIVLPPVGYDVGTPLNGIVEAVRDAHLADEHDIIVEPGDEALPEIDEDYGTLRVRPIALSTEDDAPYFRLRYELLDGEPMVRVTSEGVDQDITRILQMDFRIEKKIEYALLSPNRIMIGKNVMVEGPLGSCYGWLDGAAVDEELNPDNGDPLVMRSDFYHLNDDLDATLDTFFTQLADYDADGDGRLRPEHPTEGDGLTGHADLVDYDCDEYVDDFDLFLEHYDSNGDLIVVYDEDLAIEAGWGAMTAEFAGIDDQLARLIDEARADRDGDGEVTDSDRALGYRDGVIDGADLYAKVTGRLAFSVTRDAWEAARDAGFSYQEVVHGPIRSGIDEAPVSFEVTEDELLELTTDMFGDCATWFEAQVPNDPPEDPVNFNAQVAANIADGGVYIAPPEIGVGMPEEVPLGSVGAYDFYYRPTYSDMTFYNVRIPMGNNGLYEDCTFVGVMYIESYTECDDENWNYTGAVGWEDTNHDGQKNADEFYVPRFTDEEGGPRTSELGDATVVEDTRPYSNNIRFHNCTFLGSIAGDRIGTHSWSYTHWRNKIQMTGSTRFYLDPEDEDLDDDPKRDEILPLLNGIDENDRIELGKSSILMPGWSIDVGNFSNEQAENPEDTPTVKLKGTMVAGILDVRGTADVFGTLLMTFRPRSGEGPLFFGGQTDVFNTTIGYFDLAEGDREGFDLSEVDGFGEIRLRYNPDALLPDGIPWPVHMAPEPGTYVEGGTS